jgi:hypothetical protein
MVWEMHSALASLGIVYAVSHKRAGQVELSDLLRMRNYKRSIRTLSVNMEL